MSAGVNQFVIKQKQDRVVIFLVAFWVLFTVTLAAWWLIFGLQQLNRLKQVQLEGAVKFQNHYQMLIWEGGVLIILLIGAGVALFYYARREQRRHAQVEEFFAAFTHDAKTALASLRLQAESLKEDSSNEPNPLLDRLLSDTLRLQLQLENSLFLVNLPTGKLFVEPVKLSHLVEVLRHHWPGLTITQRGDGVVNADVRALESVLANLLQNAVNHGQATQVSFEVDEDQHGRLRVKVADNGRGFTGNFDQLGTLFVRHSQNSGSGVGLYIARQLLKRMNSVLSFRPGDSGGFVAELSFPGASTHRRLPQAVGDQL